MSLDKTTADQTSPDRTGSATGTDAAERADGLDKTFDPAAVETRLYEGWEAQAAFACDPAIRRARPSRS